MVMRRCTAGMLFGLLVMISSTGHGAGLLTPVNSHYQSLEIKSHDVEVSVQDGYAVTQIIQVFTNPNTQNLAANYTFPIPEDASVAELTYWINGQAVTGEVVEKQQAKQIYQQQKAAGQHTALTEQDDYKAFNIKVFPVQANDQVKIKLVYFQQIKIDTAMGRYVYPLEEGGVEQAKSSFWNRNDKVAERFSFTMNIDSGYPLDGVRLPQHNQAKIEKINPQQWHISYDNIKVQGTESTDIIRLDQDIVVYWRHQSDLPGSVDLVTYRAENHAQGTFMLTLTPGDDLAKTSGSRDWVFVLDKSGSMNDKYATLIEGVRQGLDKLPQGDRFKLITFNDSAHAVTPGYLAVTPANVNQALMTVNNQGVDGGTNLYAGLDSAMQNLDSDRSSAIILVTDGVANVGITEKKDFLKLLESRDVRLFSFIMGNSANRPLLEGMTNISNGFFANISNADDIMGQIMLATSKMTHQAMRNVTVDIEGLNVDNLSPQRLPTLYRGQQLIVFGHYTGQGDATIKLSGQVNGKTVQYQTKIEFPSTQSSSPELERLWAYSQIKDLEQRINYFGESSELKQSIINLSVEYGLVTNYTSLLVVEQNVFEQLGIVQNNKTRIAREAVAKTQRSNSSSKSNKVDSQQPMFTSNRPSTGGGSSGPLTIITLMLFIIVRMRAGK